MSETFKWRVFLAKKSGGSRRRATLLKLGGKNGLNITGNVSVRETNTPGRLLLVHDAHTTLGKGSQDFSPISIEILAGGKKKVFKWNHPNQVLVMVMSGASIGSATLLEEGDDIRISVRKA